MASAKPLPEGTVTFLFTDIEGSTTLWERHPEAMRVALARHDALLRHAIAAHGGHVFKSMGDQFRAAFATAPEALGGALAAQRALHAETWGEASPLRVRMVLHTGAVEYQEGDYFGPPLKRLSRLLDTGHGGQVLLSQAASDLVRSALPEAASLRDLGTHRLKDLQQPEPLFQLVHPDLPGEFPPLRSMEAFAHNLPVQLSRFIGREQAMAEVKRLHASTRLLTLTGSGGCGKTRLALQVAVDLLDEFGDGVWLVELAPLADPVLVPQAVAAALGVREESGRLLTATLMDYLRPKQALLVLDNCEHVLSACAQLAEALLRVCPQLRILASSREALGIGGEQTYRVPSLSLPDGRRLPPLERLHEFEAVQLFTDRARSSEATFAVTQGNAPAVAQLCCRLDGMPLALELAAAWARTLTPAQLLERLSQRFDLLVGHRRNVPARHQSLRAAIEWSYQLLSPELRRFFARLSVFRGGWTLEAAEAVTGEPRALSYLQQLQECSLVVAEEAGEAMRYRLLETLREFAAEQVEPGERRELTRRHATFFLALVERADAAAEGEEGPARLQEVEQEYDNLRAALDGCFPSDPSGDATAMTEDVELGLALGAALGSFWIVRGYFTEGRRYLRALLARSEALVSRARARASIIAGRLAQLQDGSDAAACQLLEAGLEMARTLEDRSLVASTLLFFGDQARAHLTAEQCQARCEEALALYRELGDRRGAAVALITLGLVCGAEYQRRARAFYEEGVAALRELGPSRSLAWACFHLSHAYYYMGDYEPASAVGRECLSLFEQFAEPAGIAACHNLRGKIALAQGDLPNARRHFETLHDLSLDLGSSPGVAEARVHLGDVDLAAGDVDGAAALYQQALAVAREVNARDQVAASLAGLGRAALRRGDARQAAYHFVECFTMDRDWRHLQSALPCLEGVACALTLAAVPVGDPAPPATAAPPPELLRAARLFGAAEALRDRIGVQLPPLERSEHDGWIATLRASLGNADLAAAWEAGRTLSWEEAVSCALGQETWLDRQEATGEEPFAIAWAEGRAMTPEQVVASALQDGAEAEPHDGRVTGASRDPLGQVVSEVPLHSGARREERMAGLRRTVPRPPDSFIGRAKELEAVKSLLTTHWLVTLTGPAGIGKTRLALRIAEELAPSFPEGVYFVPLVDLTDPVLVAQAVALALGVREHPDRSLVQALTEHLSSQSVLLVWDNCDYVAEGCRALAQALFDACPQAKILATSRRSLRIQGETLYAVPPFSFPEAGFAQTAGNAAELLLAYEAPDLFQHRAGAILTGFTIQQEDAAAVAQICRRLDGIPLAVELAAGRIRELSTTQIAARLDERFHLLTGGATSTTHQQTLRTAIDWSHELLSEAEQTLLARLSIFAGGWELEAAEQVCSGGIVAERSVLDLLTGLIDTSWVVGETRQQGTRAAGGRHYRMLETIREYSRERLSASGEEAELLGRYAQFYLKLAEEVDAQFRQSVQETWLDRVENEYENLRTALAWCLTDEREVETGLLLARALRRFWEVRGYLSEGRALLAQALGREGGKHPTRERAEALNAAAVLAWMQGDAEAARALFDESLAIERTLGDTEGVACSLHHLGHVASERGEYETAKGLYQESLALFRELHNPPGIAFSLADQGNMALKEGDLGAARSFYEESLRISRELDHKVSIAIALNNLGKIAREQGDTRAAWALHRESLTIRMELGDKGGYPWSLEAFARLAAPTDPERAVRLWGAADALRESLGLPLPPNELEEYDRYRSAARQALGEALFAIAWTEGRAMTPEQAVASALRDGAEAEPRPRAARGRDDGESRSAGGGPRAGADAAGDEARAAVAVPRPAAPPTADGSLEPASLVGWAGCPARAAGRLRGIRKVVHGAAVVPGTARGLRRLALPRSRG